MLLKAGEAAAAKPISQAPKHIKYQNTIATNEYLLCIHVFQFFFRMVIRGHGWDA